MEKMHWSASGTASGVTQNGSKISPGGLGEALGRVLCLGRDVGMLGKILGEPLGWHWESFGSPLEALWAPLGRPWKFFEDFGEPWAAF